MEGLPDIGGGSNARKSCWRGKPRTATAAVRTGSNSDGALRLRNAPFVEQPKPTGVYSFKMSEFIPGLKLSRLFFEQAVRPVIERTTPELKYATALIGSGSEVLGFDDEMSADHHWGPRVMLFLNENDHADKRNSIDAALREQLPAVFLGYPTNFSEPDAKDNNVQKLVAVDSGPINHRVDIFTIRDYLLAYLNFDIDREIEPADWLTFPEQKLRSITADTIFHDEIGLKSVLERFSYY